MKITDKGLSIIKDMESLRLTAYVCPAGVLTIGYGHTGPDVYAGETITAEDAEAILKRDLGRFEACVSKTCPDTDQEQFDAMVSLAFNIGDGAFKKSSVARLHNAGRYAEAAQAFMLWNKGGGKVLPGLVRRRAAESALYVSGPTPEEDIPTTPVGLAEGEDSMKASRTINGGTIATVATAGSIATTQAPALLQTVTDNQDLITTLLPYMTGKTALVLGILALAAIGYMMYARYSDRQAGRS